MNSYRNRAKSKIQLSNVEQNRMLIGWKWTDEGKKRVRCTYYTVQLLKQAGVFAPQPMEFYEVDVHYIEPGFLVLGKAVRSEKMVGKGE